MNFYTHWEGVWIQKCISLFIWRVKTFFIYCPLKNGGYMIVAHTLSNGIALFSPIFEVLENVQGKNHPAIPNDARLMYAILGSALIVLGTVLLFGLIKLRLSLLINFVLGIEIIIFIFPIIFSVAYVRVYVQTLEYFRQAVERSPEDAYAITQKENYVFGLLYIMLTYSVICYILYFYYVVVVLSFYDETVKANDLNKAGDASRKRQENNTLKRGIRNQN